MSKKAPVKSKKPNSTARSKASTKKTTKKRSRLSNSRYKNVYNVPTSRALVSELFAVLKHNWKTIGAVTAIYGAFYFIIVRGITSFDVSQLTSFIEETFGADINEIGTSLILTGAIFGLSSEFDQVSGLMTTILLVINSLALIWVLRHIWLKKFVSIRDSYYQGMYPLIPFVIILLIMFIQLAPFTLGAFATSSIFANEIAVTGFEKFLVGIFFLSMLLLSAYWLVGSWLSLYIVTIPDMTPMRALRSAKTMLKNRRLLVLQRVLVFAIGSLVLAFAILLLSVYVYAPLAPILVSLFAVISLPLFHTYMFIIYKHLLED